MSIDEAFPAVVHKPARHICPKHSVCPVVLLQAPARTAAGGVRSQARAGPACGSGKQTPSPLLFSAPLLVPYLPPHPRSPSHSKHQSPRLGLEGQRKSRVSLETHIPFTEPDPYGLFQQRQGGKGKGCKLTFKWTKTPVCQGSPHKFPAA